ncbi:MAG: hypothetical protein KKA70_12670 [Proteobacteria bacterium]|nr:hypothetical protein [Pseudomonadota bacterium]
MAPLPSGNICRIAVLPFINETSFKDGETLFYKVFQGEIANTGNYTLAQEGDIRKVYRKMNIYPGENPSFTQMKILADRLNTQLFISGRLIEMQEATSPSSTDAIVGVYLTINDAKNGRALWSTYHRREGLEYLKILHFGQINSVISLSRVVSREIIDAWFKSGFKACE